MIEEKDTKLRLLESAKKEFTDKGFMKASLRTICKNAGVTTGALYFFFHDKDDLFGAIVKGPLQEVAELVKNHIEGDEKAMASEEWKEMLRNFWNDEKGNLYQYVPDNGETALGRDLVHCLYSNYDAVILLLTKAQGSSYENCVNDLVDMVEVSYHTIFKQMSAIVPQIKENAYMSHWMTYLNVESYIHLLSHIRDEKEALKQVEKFVPFLQMGWYDLVIVKNE